MAAVKDNQQILEVKASITATPQNNHEFYTAFLPCSSFFCCNYYGFSLNTCLFKGTCNIPKQIVVNHDTFGLSKMKKTDLVAVYSCRNLPFTGRKSNLIALLLPKLEEEERSNIN